MADVRGPPCKAGLRRFKGSVSAISGESDAATIGAARNNAVLSVTAAIEKMLATIRDLLSGLTAPTMSLHLVSKVLQFW